MKRIDIYYGGERYSVGTRTFEEISAEVDAALAAGHDWIRVNDGDGAPRMAYLLITPGVPLAIVPIPDEDPNSTGPIVDISDKLIPS